VQENEEQKPLSALTTVPKVKTVTLNPQAIPSDKKPPLNQMKKIRKQ